MLVSELCAKFDPGFKLCVYMDGDPDNHINTECLIGMKSLLGNHTVYDWFVSDGVLRIKVQEPYGPLIKVNGPLDCEHDYENVETYFTTDGLSNTLYIHQGLPVKRKFVCKKCGNSYRTEELVKRKLKEDES